MTEQALHFVQTWAKHNLRAYSIDDTGPAQYAKECVAAAKALGISKDEIEIETGPLIEYFAEAIKEDMDSEEWPEDQDICMPR